MNQYKIYCYLSGEHFYPSILSDKLSEFIIHSMNDKGEISNARNGERFSYDFGNLILIPKSEITNNFDIIFSEFINSIKKLQNQSDLHAVNTVIHLDLIYDTQCNFELTPDQIKLLGGLKATFSIACYQNS